MPVGYYIIPAVPGPYSRQNPMRPQYVDEIRCNWTGYPVPSLAIFICKVNSTDVKLADLDSRNGVYALPRGYTWDTPLLSLPAGARVAISNWCANHNIVYDENETIGELLLRIINSDLFNIFGVPRDATFGSLNSEQKNRILNLFIKHNLAPPSDTETVASISKRGGGTWWNAPLLYVPEF